MIHGYLDPASGSAIISAVAAGGAGIVVGVKTMMTKMRLRKRKEIDETEATEDEITDAPTDGVDETSDELTQ